MNQIDKAQRINEMLLKIRAELDALGLEGEEIPAVQKGVLRMSGTLRALENQFAPLMKIS